jgi:hypothetical protein
MVVLAYVSTRFNGYLDDSQLVLAIEFGQMAGNGFL